MPSSKSLRITEYDEASIPTATYVHSEAGAGKPSSRVDVILPEGAKSPYNIASLWARAVDVFLPVGFPHSVTDDYLEYQIYDSLQAFSSSIASLLSSRAVLSSVGVGDSTASPTTALLLSILQDSAGRISTILFAHRFGMSLEPECKMYRLMADVLNDTGFVLDCLSPIFPKPMRVAILSFSSVLRSLCGVAAGSSKASLSAHFAKQGNLGELNAKDSSQETVISLVGMLVGSWVITLITTPFATWTALILLLSIHLETNRRAVRAVKMHTLNRQRAGLVYHHLLQGHVPTPEEIAREERIFERDGVLRDRDDAVLGYCSVGAPMSRLMSAIGDRHDTTSAVHIGDGKLNQILNLYQQSPYILWTDRSSRSNSVRIFVVLKKEVQPKDMIVAWWQALNLATGELGAKAPADAAAPGATTASAQLDLFQSSQLQALNLLETYETQLKERGWDLEVAALETVASRRVVIEV